MLWVQASARHATCEEGGGQPHISRHSAFTLFLKQALPCSNLCHCSYAGLSLILLPLSPTTLQECSSWGCFFMWVLGSSLQVVQQALLPAETFCCPHCDLILVFRLGSFSRPDFHFSGPFLANQAHCCHPENIVAFISLTVLAPGKFNPLISSFVAYIPSSYLPLCFCNHLCFLKTIISVLSGNSYVSITPKNQV